MNSELGDLRMDEPLQELVADDNISLSDLREIVILLY